LHDTQYCQHSCSLSFIYPCSLQKYYMICHHSTEKRPDNLKMQNRKVWNIKWHQIPHTLRGLDQYAHWIGRFVSEPSSPPKG
jgi:hypothetical protein